MNAINVREVMQQDAFCARNFRKGFLLPEEVQVRTKESEDAYAALAELIEADKEYDKARMAYGRIDSTDNRIRLNDARTRRGVALTNCGAAP